jgi:hypothetical protein
MEAPTEERSYYNGRHVAFMVIIWGLRAHQWRNISLKSERPVAYLVMV